MRKTKILIATLFVVGQTHGISVSAQESVAAVAESPDADQSFHFSKIDRDQIGDATNQRRLLAAKSDPFAHPRLEESGFERGNMSAAEPSNALPDNAGVKIVAPSFAPISQRLLKKRVALLPNRVIRSRHRPHLESRSNQDQYVDFSSGGSDSFSSSAFSSSAIGVTRGTIYPTAYDGPPPSEVVWTSGGDVFDADASMFNPIPRTAEFADRYDSPHWQSERMPLKVYISKTVEDARRGYVQDTIYAALKDWCNASANKVRFEITYKYNEADITFVSNSTSENQWAESSVDFHKGMYDRVRVSMLLETLYNLEPKRLRAVCLHEAGHALGITRHSIQNTDVMSLSATDDFHPLISLTEGDKALLCKLYK